MSPVCLGNRQRSQWDTPVIRHSLRAFIAVNKYFRFFSATQRGTASDIRSGPSRLHYGKWRHGNAPKGIRTTGLSTGAQAVERVVAQSSPHMPSEQIAPLLTTSGGLSLDCLLWPLVQTFIALRLAPGRIAPLAYMLHADHSGPCGLHG